MKSTVLSFMFSGVFIASASAAVSNGTIDKLYHSLDDRSWCGNTLMGIEMEFQKNIPDSEKPDVLAKIIERAGNQNQSLILDRAIEFAADIYCLPDPQPPLPPRLENALLSQLDNPRPEVRQSLAEFFINRHEAKWHARILAFLKDPSDDVRETVLRRIYGKPDWPDTMTIYHDYLSHTPREGHQHSLTMARMFSNPTDMKRCEAVDKLLPLPDAQVQLHSYIARHQNDPDYEFSVRSARGALQMLADNLAYRKSQEEEKSREDELHRTTADVENGRSAPPVSQSENIDHLLWLFDTSDPSARQYAERYFGECVPRQDHLAVLTALFERGGSAKNQNILQICVELAEYYPQAPKAQRLWSEKLESLVWAQRSNPDKLIRSFVARDLNVWGHDERREKILSFLNDPDEFVREAVVSAVHDWPDHELIYKQYVAAHGSDPSVRATVFEIQELSGGK